MSASLYKVETVNPYQSESGGTMPNADLFDSILACRIIPPTNEYLKFAAFKGVFRVGNWVYVDGATKRPATALDVVMIRKERGK